MKPTSSRSNRLPTSEYIASKTGSSSRSAASTMGLMSRNRMIVGDDLLGGDETEVDLRIVRAAHVWTSRTWAGTKREVGCRRSRALSAHAHTREASFISLLGRSDRPAWPPRWP